MRYYIILIAKKERYGIIMMSKKIFCIVVALMMVFSSTVFAVDDPLSTHSHDELCEESDICCEDDIITPMAAGTCYLGHWFRTKKVHSVATHCISIGDSYCKISCYEYDVCTNCGDAINQTYIHGTFACPRYDGASCAYGHKPGWQDA